MAEMRHNPAGVTSWIDVECGDVEAAKAFYAGLFGWTFADATPPEAPFRYVIAQLDGNDVAGIGGPAGSAAWNTYVAVDDAQAATALVVAAGLRRRDRLGHAARARPDTSVACRVHRR